MKKVIAFLVGGLARYVGRHRLKYSPEALVSWKPKRILIASNTALGDTLFSTPLFREVRRAFPEAHITALLNPLSAELFRTNPYIDEIELYRGRWNKFLLIWWRLWRRERYDVAVIGHSNEPQITPLCLLLRIPRIICIPNANNLFRAEHFNPPVSFDPSLYIVAVRLKMMSYLGVETPCSTRLELFLKPEWIAEAKGLLRPWEGRRLIGFQIGASTCSRQWFIERWVELARAILADDERAIIVLTGSPKERAVALSVAENLPKERVFVAAGVAGITGAAALIGELELFITPDTGPLHVAVALGVPTISLFGVADPSSSLPDYDREKHRFVKVPRCCDPCVDKRCKYQACMEAISVEMVYEKYRQWRENRDVSEHKEG